MNSKLLQLLNLELEIELSEPWEIVAEIQDKKLYGKIIEISGEKAVVKLSEDLTIMQIRIEYLLISVRYENQKLIDLKNKQKITLGFEYTAKSEKNGFFAVNEQYRGHVGFIGSALAL